mgnify:CR=1 FL=1
MAEETQELRRAGLKVTLPRLRILQLLDGATQKHVTADDVHQIGRASCRERVYCEV